MLTAALVALPAVGARGRHQCPAIVRPNRHPNPKHGVPFHGKLARRGCQGDDTDRGHTGHARHADTKITKDGQPATLADGVVGEPVGGAYMKADDGKLNATVVHFGAKARKPGNQPGKPQVPLDSGGTQ